MAVEKDQKERGILPQAQAAKLPASAKKPFSFGDFKKAAQRLASEREAILPQRRPTAQPSPAPIKKPSHQAVDAPILAQRSAVDSQAQAALTGMARPIFNFKPKSASASSIEATIEQSMPDHFIGELMQVTMYGRWGRGMARNDKGVRINLVGDALDGLTEGARYKFSGNYIQHPRFGKQLEVQRANPDVESSIALERHMTNNFRNVGPAIARKVVQYHEERGTINELRSNLIHNPSAVDFTAFTTRIVTLKDDEESKCRRVKDSFSIRFGGLGISSRVLKDLAEALTAKAQFKISDEDNGRDLVALANKMLDDNPYSLIDGVDGYAFGSADRIARKIGIDLKDPRRVGALVQYALRTGCEDRGHNYLSQPQLFESILRLDGTLDPSHAVQVAVREGVGIAIDSEFGQDRFYDKKLRQAETNIVEIVADRILRPVKPLTTLVGQALQDAIDHAQKVVGQHKGKPDYKLDESQRAALVGLLTSTCSLHTLTAGPGSGKTDIMEVLMQVLSGTKAVVACAPVGKAAKVLNGRIGRFVEPKTIHSTLEYRGGFARNAGNPLDADLVLADETSMLGTPLGSAFLDALPEDAHLIMLGDTGQLAPIEPGEILKSLLQLEQLDHHRLTKTHRNHGSILELVKSISLGRCDIKNTEDVHFIGHLPEPTEGEASRLAATVHLMAQKYGGLEHIGVICPIRKGEAKKPGWNVTWLNAILRDALNPEGERSQKVSGTTFRLNDRIIVTRNMSIPFAGDAPPSSRSARPAARNSAPVFDESGRWLDDLMSDIPASDHETEDDENKTYVVNGDTGWLEDVHYKLDDDGIRRIGYLVLRLDDDRKVLLPGACVEDLSLAYAITTHAAQGSEYKKVFAFCLDGHESFMHQAMLRTMLSRAREELTIFGSQQVLSKVAARKPPARNCAIVERVLEQLSEQLNEQIQTRNQDQQRSREVA